MKFFLDTGDLNHIRQWMPTGVISGVTMNPLILRQAGVEDVEAQAAKVVREALGHPVSVQVSSCDPDTIRAEAKLYSGIGPSVLIKVPAIDSNGMSMLPMIAELENSGIPVNVTACMNALQAITASMAGATYVSLLGGRIEDEGGDAPLQTRITREWIDATGAKTQVIIGSVREPSKIYSLLPSKPHVITLSPAVLAKALDHGNSRRTVAEFEAAAR